MTSKNRNIKKSSQLYQQIKDNIFLFDNFKHYTPLFKALSIDPVYNNNTAQLAFL